MLISAPCRSCNPKRAPAGVTGAVATGVGRELANRLGLRLPKREGHDLAGPCISCKSSDAFRLHQDSGVAHCYSCQASWSPFQVAELILSDREQAKRLLVELGHLSAESERRLWCRRLACRSAAGTAAPQSRPQRVW